MYPILKKTILLVFSFSLFSCSNQKKTKISDENYQKIHKQKKGEPDQSTVKMIQRLFIP